jgi:hypothetical protein
VVRDLPERLRALENAGDDVLDAGRVLRIETVEADEFGVDVALAPAVD